MANDDIVQKVVIEVDDEQLKQIGDTAQESFDKLKEQTDKASESLGKLGEKADETTKDLEKLGEGSGEGLDKLDESTQKAADALNKLAEDGGHSFEEIQKAADYAGTSLEDFAKLSERTQEQYVEYANRTVEESHAAADAIGEIPKAADDAAQGVKQLGPAMEGMGESAGHAHINARALNLILRQFGLGELGHIIHGIERVGLAFGALGVAALAVGVIGKHLAELGEQAAKTAESAEKLSKVLADNPETIERMARGFEQAGGKLKTFVEYLDNLVLKMARLNELKGLSPEQIKSLEDGANNAQKLKDQFTDLITRSSQWPRSLNDVGIAVKGTISPLVNAGKAAEALDEALLKIPGVMVNGKVVYAEYEKQLNRLYNRMDDFGKLKLEEIFRKMGIPPETIKTIELTTEEYDKLQQKLKDTAWRQDAYKEFDEFFKHLKGGMSDVLQDWQAAFAAGIPRIFTTFKSGFLDPIGEAFVNLGKLAVQFFGGIPEAAQRAWEQFKQLVNDYIVQPVKDAWDAVVDYVTRKAGAAYKAVQDAWKDFKQWAYDTFYKPIKDAWDQAVDYISGKVDQVLGFLRSIKQAAIDAWGAIKGMFSAGSGDTGGVGAAGGGYILGPGSSTSDSIPAWLSTGEFVMRAAAVQAYGLRAMHALNSLQAPRFAGGGLAVPVPRSSPSGTGQRTLTLNIEGRSFQGLQIPERTAQSLERFAVHSQIASAGRKQSWRR